MGYWSGSRGRQARAVDPGPIYAARQGRGQDRRADLGRLRRRPRAGMSRLATPERTGRGFACFVGRPNAGKSTLTNAIVGTKVVDHLLEAADHPDRRARDRAPPRRPADPGRHPRAAPSAHAARRAAQRPGHQHLGRGRRRGGVLPGQREARSRRPVPGQRAGQGRVVRRRSRWPPRPTSSTPEQLGAAPARDRGARRARPAPTGPRSCRSRRRTATRSSCSTDLLVAQLPEGPQLYPDGELTDAPEEAIVAELIREAALEGVRDELPHSIAVVVEEMGLKEGRPADKPLLTSTPTCSSSGPRRRAS